LDLIDFKGSGILNHISIGDNTKDSSETLVSKVICYCYSIVCCNAIFSLYRVSEEFCLKSEEPTKLHIIQQSLRKHAAMKLLSSAKIVAFWCLNVISVALLIGVHTMG
jgi:hypothetical protein